MVRANIPLKFRNTTLWREPKNGRERFKPYGGGGSKPNPLAIESGTRAISVCEELRDLYLDAFLHGKKVEDPHGLLLHGGCGRGKTRLACSMLCDLIHAGLFDVKFIEYNELFKQIRFSYQGREIDNQELFHSLTHAKVLVIDDFGLEVSGALVWVLDNIGYIINERYGRNLPTILTCNYWKSIKQEAAPPNEGEARRENPYETHFSWEIGSVLKQREAELRLLEHEEALQERVSYRLRSRIREMCLELKVEGYDYRKKIGKNRDISMEVRRERRRGAKRG